MRLGLLSKVRRAIKRGNLLLKIAPYLWFFSGFGLIVGTFYRLRPIKKGKIVLYNFRGLGFGDHQKYIALELLRRNAPVEIVWLARDVEAVRKTAPEGVRVVKYAPFPALRELSTAQFWCANQSQNYFIWRGLRKRKGQTYIQTYHGSLGIKRIGADRVDDGTLKLWVSVLKYDAKIIDYLISNSTWESDVVYKSRFFGHGECKLFGHPRNDVFFKDQTETSLAVRAKYEIPPNAKILFYAPTHRTDRRLDVIVRDFKALRAAVERRFGGTWRIMMRLHPNMIGYTRGMAFGEDIVDATRHPDMQELLIAANALVTDYSSCMFDFMLTRRPVFVHAPDMEEYERTQGFYYPMSETPFPVARTEAELAENIAKFDDAAYRAGVEAFLKDRGCVEDGKATSRVVDLIMGGL